MVPISLIRSRHIRPQQLSTPDVNGLITILKIRDFKSLYVFMSRRYDGPSVKEQICIYLFYHSVFFGEKKYIYFKIFTPAYWEDKITFLYIFTPFFWGRENKIIFIFTLVIAGRQSKTCKAWIKKRMDM